MRIAFKTFGCRANSTDTDALYLEARRRGFEIVADTDPADAYVINTCTVTENADRNARHQAFRFKRQNSGALVAMVGNAYIATGVVAGTVVFYRDRALAVRGVSATERSG